MDAGKNPEAAREAARAEARAERKELFPDISELIEESKGIQAVIDDLEKSIRDMPAFDDVERAWVHLKFEAAALPLDQMPVLGDMRRFLINIMNSLFYPGRLPPYRKVKARDVKRSFEIWRTLKKEANKADPGIFERLEEAQVQIEILGTKVEKMISDLEDSDFEKFTELLERIEG